MLASAKRVDEFNVLSVHQTCIEFSSGNTKVTLQPDLALCLKCFGSLSPIDLVSYLPPLSSEGHESLHMLCAVWVLHSCVDRTKSFRKGNQLFVSRVKNWLTHWIVKDMTSAYSAKGLVPPEGLCVHILPGVSDSWMSFFSSEEAS